MDRDLVDQVVDTFATACAGPQPVSAGWDVQRGT